MFSIMLALTLADEVRFVDLIVPSDLTVLYMWYGIGVPPSTGATISHWTGTVFSV